MRNPETLNTVDNYYDDNGNTIIDINNIPQFEMDDYDLLDEKDFKKYISDLESIVRMSFEYRQLIYYLKMDEGMDECSFLENVSSRDNPKIKIEIHHEPFTLYDICMAIAKKRMALHEDMDIELVAEEVAYVHYLGWVGLIPLSTVIHDLVHNQYLFIPLDKVRGNYNAFKNAYYNYIDPETLDCLDISEQATLEYDKKYKDQLKLLNRHDIYINAEGSYSLPKKDEVRNLIRNRIDTIKNNKIILARRVNK